MLSEKHAKKQIKRLNYKRKVKEKLDYWEKWDEYKYENNKYTKEDEGIWQETHLNQGKA